MYLLHSMLSLLIWHEQLFTLIKILKYCATLKNKKIAGSEECSPNGYCLQKAELVIKHYLYTKTWQRKPCFMKIIKEITQVKCKIGLWFLFCVLSPIYIYECTKFNFNPFCTFQDMARTDIHYENNEWLRGDNTVNIQGRIIVSGFCPSSYCHLSIYQVWFKCQQ